jgi:hypothetical protein
MHRTLSRVIGSGRVLSEPAIVGGARPSQSELGYYAGPGAAVPGISE